MAYLKETLSGCENESRSVMFNSLWPHGLYSPWNSPGQNTGVGSLSLLQGIFPTQISNSSRPHCRWILYQLSHQGSPRILGWVVYPFTRENSWPRNTTRVSCIAGGFFTHWATWETPKGRITVCAAKSLQLCPTLCDPIDGSPPGFPVPGILQARTLEWVAISFSNAWKWKVKSESEVAQSCWLLATPWTAKSIEFSRPEY